MSEADISGEPKPETALDQIRSIIRTVLYCAGLVGAAMTLYSNLDNLIWASQWFKAAAFYWRELTHAFWASLFQFLHIPFEISPLTTTFLTFASLYFAVLLRSGPLFVRDKATGEYADSPTSSAFFPLTMAATIIISTIMFMPYETWQGQPFSFDLMISVAQENWRKVWSWDYWRNMSWEEITKQSRSYWGDLNNVMVFVLTQIAIFLPLFLNRNTTKPLWTIIALCAALVTFAQVEAYGPMIKEILTPPKVEQTSPGSRG